MHEATLTIVDDDHIEVNGTGWENGAHREGYVLWDEASAEEIGRTSRVRGALFFEPLGVGHPDPSGSAAQLSMVSPISARPKPRWPQCAVTMTVHAFSFGSPSSSMPTMLLLSIFSTWVGLPGRQAAGLVPPIPLCPAARPGSCESPLLLRDVLLVAFGIHEGVCLSLLEEGVPFHHAVIAAVRTEKHVAGQALENLEGPGKVGGDFGVVFVVRQAETQD